MEICNYAIIAKVGGKRIVLFTRNESVLPSALTHSPLLSFICNSMSKLTA